MSFEDEDEDRGEGEGSGSSSSSDDSSIDEESSQDEDQDEDELEENIPPGMAANVSSKPKRLPCVAAQKWTFRATIRCERTGKWALLWESDSATTFYTEEPDESWQAYLPQGSLSEFFCLPLLRSLPLPCFQLVLISRSSLTPSLRPSLRPSLPFFPPGVLSNWHSLYTTHASMLNVEAGATFYVQPKPLAEDEVEGVKDEREKEWVFATVKTEDCGEYAVSFVGLSFKAPDIYFLGQFIRSLLD